jgi:hypothetical protein
MKTGNGKIANLPAEIRDQLNYRIAEGEEGIELVAWLNSKPEVTEVVNKLFDGTPISEQNLSEWRKRGYQKWLAHRNMFDESNALGDNAEVLAETGIDCDKLLLTLTAAYAEAIQNWIVTPCEQMTYKLAVYKNLTNGVIALRRAEIQKVRLEIDRERLELLREKRRHKSESSASEAIGRGAGVGAGGCPGKGGGPGKSRASLPSSPESASREGAASSSLARPEAPEPTSSVAPSPPPCDGPVISQNLASPEPLPAPTPSTPAPTSNSSSQPSARRANVPQNAPPGTVISLNPIRIVQRPSVRPTLCMAPGSATQTPTPSAPKPSPSRAIVHR